MKKLFRFKYEPCNGTCYTYKPIFFNEMKKVENKKQLVSKIVEAHDKLCDNPNFYFGLDMCEKTGLFIGHFVQPDRTDMFSGSTIEECTLEMSERVINTEIPEGTGDCVFGDSGDENLAQQILEAC